MAHKHKQIVVSIPENEYHELQAIGQDRERVPEQQAAFFVREGLRVVREYEHDPERCCKALISVLERPAAGKKITGEDQSPVAEGGTDVAQPPR